MCVDKIQFVSDHAKLSRELARRLGGRLREVVPFDRFRTQLS